MMRVIFAIGLLALTVTGRAADQAADIEFFEAKIRPVLVEHCYECHSGKTLKLKGGLRVDARDLFRKGGDSGVAFEPRNPESSLLIKSLKYEDLQMPPKGKLPESVIKDFEEWIRRGAVDPRTSDATTKSGSSNWEETLKQRRQWWAFNWQPTAATPVVDAALSQRIDERINARLRELSIASAPRADRRTLARRLSFALLGLPPTYEEVAAFERDESPQAVERFTDRLLTSPHFGERWARHWMDVVRYCETHGSEFDNHIPFAWRYRDYLIRAFNDDLPFDQFTREHIAGDLLPEPRWRDGINESRQALAFWRFVEFYQTPVDVKREEGIVRESEIDALTKAFQAMTVSCARCHEHKFDPISQHDYYALYGIFASSRIAVRTLTDPQQFEPKLRELKQLKPALRTAIADDWSQQLKQWPTHFAAVAELLRQPQAKDAPSKPTETATRPAVVRAVLQAADDKSKNWLSGLLPLLKLPPTESAEFARLWSEQAKRLRDEDSRASRFADGNVVIANFAPTTTNAEAAFNWRVDGLGLPTQPLAKAGDFSLWPTGNAAVRALHERGLHSDGLSDRCGGSVRSPSFMLTHDAVSVQARGDGNARVRLVIENHQGDHLLFASVNPNINGVTSLRWFRLPLRSQWRGARAHVEIITRDDKPNLTQLKDASILEKSDGRSAFGIARVVLHNNNSAPSDAPLIPDDLVTTECRSSTEFAERLTERTAAALQRWRDDQTTDADARWLNAVLEAGLLDNVPGKESPLAKTLAQYRAIENSLPIPQRICGLADDGTGLDAAFFPRGDHRRPGELVPRRYLEVLGSRAEDYRGAASGRLKLAEEIASPTNPLTARVYVNRVWHWLFGRGLVSTVDNFGKLGEQPTHPELLDDLARSFVAQRWSTKKLIRAIVLSETWQRASLPTAAAQERDPDNIYWSHARITRIDAESLRDSMLVIAGNINAQQFGPSVPVFHRLVVDPDKQPPSGPIDGGGRRSVYLEVRRNFLNDFLVTFDFPKPVAPTGRRSETNVPAQNLTLMNDPFVKHEAGVFAKRLLAAAPDFATRCQLLHQAAFQRSATAEEAARLAAYVGTPSNPDDELAAWSDIAQVTFNSKELLYLK